MIQMLTYNGINSAFEGSEMVINSIHDAQSLDEFEINIVNLSDESLWRSRGRSGDTINEIQNLRSLAGMIRNSVNTKIIIIFPQNIPYYHYYLNGKYQYVYELKDRIELLTKDIFPVVYSTRDLLYLYYENTKTKVGLREIGASFYFHKGEDILLKSEKSNKPTAIKWGKVVLTTLDIQDYDDTIAFLSAINLLKKKEAIPEWAETIKMFDDNAQSSIIEANRLAIQEAEENIEKAQDVLDKNNEYKSILYTKGDELVKVVFEIIEQMFGCDLSNFEDKYDEDFLFQAGGFTFIGEIKGVTPNVKNDNISQIDRHCQNYVEEHEEEDGRIKGLLIINHQRNKPLQEREPVHERQICLAKRYEVLIIETPVLLKLFEKYCSGELNRKKWLETVKENTGLLHVENII